jgi:hypothetical protein
MAKKSVEGLTPTSASPATPGLIERGVVSPTQSSLQAKITSKVDDLANQLDSMHANIPEGTMFLPLDQIKNSIRTKATDAFTIKPQYPQPSTPIPSSPCF